MKRQVIIRFQLTHKTKNSTEKLVRVIIGALSYLLFQERPRHLTVEIQNNDKKFRTFELQDDK